MKRGHLVLPLSLLAMLLSSCSLLSVVEPSAADRDATGAIVGAGEVDVFSFQAGDCLLSLETTIESQDAFDSGGVGEATQGNGVPCISTHVYEVYHVEPNAIRSEFDVNRARSIGEDICYANFESFAGISLESTSLSFSYLFPDLETFAAGDSEITCLIHLGDLAMVTGSLEGKGTSFPLEVAGVFREGDCLIDGLQPDSKLDTNPIPVSCEDPHLWEVYHVGLLDDGLTPPFDSAAQEMCVREYANFVGVEWENSSYTFSWYQPNDDTYSLGDRKVACLAHTEEGTAFSGTLNGIMR